MSNDILNMIQKKQRNADPKINQFKKIYDTIKNKMYGEEEALQTDLTPILYSCIRDCVDHGEPIIWGIIGNVGSSKSTVMGHLTDYENEYRRQKNKLFTERTSKGIKQHPKEVKEYNTYKQISGDQIEFLHIIKRIIWNCAIGIDEFNRLGETGLNSSVETTVYNTYSDIFAQQGVDRYSCAPSIIHDLNCWLILEVYGKNEQKQETTVKIIYREITTGDRRILGYANLDMKQTLKAEWYQKYRNKKFKRMELLQKYGVRKISELEIANIILETYKELEQKARGIRKVDSDIVLQTVKRVIRKQRYIGSMLAESEIASHVRGLLAIKNDIERETRRYKKANNKENPDKIELHAIKKDIQFSRELLKGEIKEQERLKTLHQKYLQIK